MSETKTVKILALESSCDETAAAIVENGRRLLADVVFSQVDLHASYKFMVCKGVNATLSGTVNNLLDYQYIGKAYNSSTSSVAASADNVYVFYNFGRTYSIRLKMTF